MFEKIKSLGKMYYKFYKERTGNPIAFWGPIIFVVILLIIIFS